MSIARLIPGLRRPSRAEAPRGGFDMLRWFAALSLACVMISGIGTAVFLSRFLSDHMLTRDAEVSAEFLKSIVDAERTWSYFADPASVASRAALESFFNHVAKLPDVVRANVFDAQGTVLWSSNPAMIGRRFTDNHELDNALRGLITVESGTVPKTEHVAMDGRCARPPLHRGLPAGPRRGWPHRGRRGGDLPPAGRAVPRHRRGRAPGLDRRWPQRRAALWRAAVDRRAGALRHGRASSNAWWRPRRWRRSAPSPPPSRMASATRWPPSAPRPNSPPSRTPEGARECVADIQREADRVERWVRDLLLQAKRRSRRPGRGRGRAAARGRERADFAPAAQRQGVALTVDAAASAGSARRCRRAGPGDRQPGRQRHRGDAGGRRAAAGRRARPVAGGQVEVSVADTGPGLPQPARDGGALFFSTKPRGTGLGLVLTRRIVEQHGGVLRLVPGPGGRAPGQ